MEKEKFKKLYNGLAGGVGAVVGINTYYVIQAGPFDFDALVIGLIVAGAIGFVLGKVPPRICDKIGKRLPAEEE